MATRAKVAKKQAKAPSKKASSPTKKAAAKKSPARILMPSGVQEDAPQPKSKKKLKTG